MKAIPIFPLAALMLAAACGGSPTAPAPTTGSPNGLPSPKPGKPLGSYLFQWAVQDSNL